MGAGNVRIVFAQWRHLPDRAHRALLWMAHRSYDKATDGKRARVYYGGREELAYALGVDVPPAPDRDATDAASEAARAARKNAFKVTDKAISTLTKAGAITLITAPRSGRRAVYELNLSASLQDVDRHEDEAGAPMDNQPAATADAGQHPSQRGPEHPSQRGPEHPSQRGPEHPSQRGPEHPSQRGPEHPSQRGPKEEERKKLGRSREEEISSQVPTSPALSTAVREVIDRRGVVPPAPRTTDQVQTGIWPHAVPTPPDHPPDPVTTRGIAAARAALHATRDTA